MKYTQYCVIARKEHQSCIKFFKYLGSAKKHAAKSVVSGGFNKAEIYLLNSVYEIGDCLLKTYLADNHKI